MVYYKLILNDKRTKEDQIYPVVVRITFKRNNTTVNSGIRVKKAEWDSSTQSVKRINPNFNSLNQSISEFYLKIQKTIHQLSDDNEFSFEALKEKLEEKSKPSKINTGITFNLFSKAVIQELLAINRTGNAIVYQTGTNRLLGFLNNRSIKFKEIDYNLLEAFKHFLIKEGVKQNTIGNYLRSIRAIYNKAIKAKIIDRSYYPFQEISIKSERTAKRAVLMNDLKAIYKLALRIDSREWHSRNYFILSFCLRGISFTDMAYLTKVNISRGMLTYKRRKTHKDYTIKLEPVAERIFNFYKDRNSKYLLPVLPVAIDEGSLQAKRIISQWIKTTNKWIRRLGERCEIEEPLTTYVARHTWATTAKRLGYSNELIAEALGHEYGNRITNIYLDNFEQNVIDDLNQKVLDGLK